MSPSEGWSVFILNLGSISSRKVTEQKKHSKYFFPLTLTNDGYVSISVRNECPKQIMPLEFFLSVLFLLLVIVISVNVDQEWIRGTMSPWNTSGWFAMVGR